MYESRGMAVTTAVEDSEGNLILTATVTGYDGGHTEALGGRSIVSKTETFQKSKAIL